MKKNKKGDPFKEFERHYPKTRSAQLYNKDQKKIKNDPAFKKAFQQFKKKYPHPPAPPTVEEYYQQAWEGKDIKINTYHRDMNELCKRFDVDPRWLGFGKVFVTKPIGIVFRRVPAPISREKFLEKKLDLDQILPVLIKQGYVKEYSDGDYRVVEDFLNGPGIIKSWDDKKNHCTYASGLDDEFKSLFPDFSKEKFWEIESILYQSFKPVVCLEASRAFSQYQYKDMELQFFAYCTSNFGKVPSGGGRPPKGNLDRKIRDCQIKKEYQKQNKEGEYNKRQIIYDLSRKYKLATRTIQDILRSHKT